MGDAVAKAFSCGKEIPTKNHQLTEREFSRGVCNPWAKLGCQEGSGAGRSKLDSLERAKLDSCDRGIGR